MSQTTPPPTAAPPPPPDPDLDDAGPRVTRDEVRDLGRLRRSRADRKVAGVAAGLARHLDIDPLVPRVAFVVLTFFGGLGLFAYVAAWLVVPSDDADDATIRLDERSRTVALWLVGGLVLLALLGNSLGGFLYLDWPLVVVALVLVLVVVVLRGSFQGSSRAAGPAGGSPSTTASGAPLPPRRRGPILFWYALAVSAIGVGVLGVVDLAGADVPPGSYPAVVLVAAGVLLVLGAFRGRGGGLILLGLVAAVATLGATAADRVDGGRVQAAPTTAAAVMSSYELTAGEIDLDLTGVRDLAALDGRTVALDLTFGRIEVLVPPGLDVVVDSQVDAGQRRIFGDRLGEGSSTQEDGSTPGTAERPELRIEADVVFGEIEVVRSGAVS